MVNAHMIETVEQSPDTVITLNTERKFIVKESVEEITKKVIEYNRQIFQQRTAIG